MPQGFIHFFSSVSQEISLLVSSYSSDMVNSKGELTLNEFWSEANFAFLNSSWSEYFNNYQLESSNLTNFILHTVNAFNNNIISSWCPCMIIPILPRLFILWTIYFIFCYCCNSSYSCTNSFKTSNCPIFELWNIPYSLWLQCTY